MFLAVLCLVGLVVLLQFNLFTIVLGAASLLLVAIYPFMKRLTYWPQLVLGLTFKWGALVGWAAVTGSLSLAPVALYAGCVLWTIGYDTIYAHQDKEDDLRARAEVDGAAGSAMRRRAGSAAFYAGAVVLWAIAGVLAGARLGFFLALALAAVQLAWQVATLDIADPGNCLDRFKSNRLVGWCCSSGSSPTWRLARLLDASEAPLRALRSAERSAARPAACRHRRALTHESC